MQSTKSKFFVAVVALAAGYCLITSFVYPGKKIINLPPEVSIIAPLQNGKFSWNTIIRYTISVNDKEDGKSEYDEINAKEVLLEVCYLPDAASAKSYTDKKKNSKQNAGLTLIRKADCFTCHASKSKLIGPSFELIAKRYPMSDKYVERLTKHVANGSKGIWGTVAMPAHKVHKASEVRQMVRWILNTGANPNLAFYPGIEGAFKARKKPAKESAKTVMVLTASYTDHGDKLSMKDSRYGQYSISLTPSN